uniref:EamA domain-containing protein n=1 Tax=Lotharella oceanica TaxID=641309 RepID=A0A7S2TXC8_9EUKA
MTAGFELGLWLFLGSTLQLTGLKLTTGSQAAVIVQLTTVFVPLLEAGFFGKTLSKNLWIGVALAFTGAALVATDQATNSGLGGLSLLQMAKGDAIVLAAALMYSMHVLRLDTYAKKVEPLQLATGKQTAQLLFSTAFAWVPALFSDSRIAQYRDFASAQTHDTLMIILAVVVWNGAVSSAFTSYAQSYGQRRLPPTLAGLLFTTQPLWAALLSSIFLHEPIGKLGACGIALVLAALAQSLVPITGSTMASDPVEEETKKNG